MGKRCGTHLQEGTPAGHTSHGAGAPVQVRAVRRPVTLLSRLSPLVRQRSAALEY
jgi:hypothetical protein